MSNNLHKNTIKIEQVLLENGLDFDVKAFPESTRTAQEAADAIGCEVKHIVKSLIFKGKDSKKPILILVSGVNRVNEKAFKEHSGERLEKADADFVYSTTGYAIGGVPPFAHNNPIDTYMDTELLEYDEIWASAGTSNTVFRIEPNNLLRVTNAKVVRL